MPLPLDAVTVPGELSDASPAAPVLSLSVVIPVKNDARMLESCLASLARQERAPGFQLIVVDNGSADGSAAVATRAGATVLFEARPGIAAASETGYDHARGDIIARIDADTVLPVDWVRNLLDAFQGAPRVDAVTGPAGFLDGPRLLRRPAAVAYLGAYFVLGALALTHVPVFGSNFAMRRSAWESVRNEIHLSPDLHDDFDLSFHLGERHRIRFAPRVRVGISMRPLIDGAGWRRVRRGFRSVAIHWPHDLPWRRLARGWRLRREASRQRPAG